MKKITTLTLLLFTSAFFYAQEIKFGKVSKEELEEKFYPLDSTTDAAYLLKKRRTFFKYTPNNGFEVVTEYHDRIKIYSKEGLKYATKNITYYKPESGEKERVHSIKAHIYNIDNNKINKTKLSSKNIYDEKLNKYRSQKKVTFPNTKEGSIIDLKYSVSSPYWDIRSLNYQYNIPIELYNCRIEIPEYFFFNKKSKGFYSIPIKESKKTGTINITSKNRTGFLTIKSSFKTSKINYDINTFDFLGKNIPPLLDNEPFSGNIKNYRGSLKFELAGTKFPGSQYKNYATTWKGVCKTIYKSPNFGNELEKSGYYQDDLKKILVPSNNDIEKIALIFQYVKTNIKWNEYYGKYTEKGVKKAYKEGNGNVAEINLILTSMLRSAGLNANPVLVSTKNNGIPIFPTLDGYNYIISKVNLPNGKSVLLDATDNYSTINTLPYRVLNWYGREIHKNGFSEKVNLIPSHYSKESNFLHLKIEDTGDIYGLYRKTLTNHFAKTYREENNIKKEENIIASFEDKNKIEIQNFKILNKKNLSKSIIQSIKFTSEDLVEELNDKLYFSPLLFLATKENPFKSKNRNFPVNFGIPWQENFSISITIPSGYSVESYPKDLAIGLPENLGLYKYKINAQGNKIKISSVLQINSNIIAPQFYPLLKDFYKQLVEKQTEKIILRKSTIK